MKKYKRMCQEVVQIDPSTKIKVNEFSSVAQAQQYCSSSKSKSIGKCCRGEQQIAYGYCWKYKKDCIFSGDKVINLKIEKNDEIAVPKKVIKKTINNTVLEEFSSLYQAAKAMNGGIFCPNKRNNIRYCCNGIQNTAYGFKWSWKI